jgi:hypothetical protein
MTEVATTETRHASAPAFIAVALLFLARFRSIVIAVLTAFAGTGLLTYLAVQGEWTWFAVMLLLATPIVGTVGWLATLIITGPLYLMARFIDRDAVEQFSEGWD